mgnify:CR=1 FL=1
MAKSVHSKWFSAFCLGVVGLTAASAYAVTTCYCNTNTSACNGFLPPPGTVCYKAGAGDTIVLAMAGVEKGRREWVGIAFSGTCLWQTGYLVDGACNYYITVHSNQVQSTNASGTQCYHSCEDVEG